MEENNKKELIEVIKARLQNADPIPYKEGAWETYRAKYEPKQRRVSLAYWSAAAALAAVAFTTLFLLKENTVDVLVPTQRDAQVVQQEKSPITILPQQEPQESVPSFYGAPVNVDRQHLQDIAVADNRQPTLDKMSMVAVLLDTPRPLLSRLLMLDTERTIAIGRPQLVTTDAMVEGSNLGSAFVLAQQVVDGNLQQQEAGLRLSPKKFDMNNKLEFGAFLSPSTTSQSFDVGGGLLMAYQLSDKVAVRTGASFNQYEVGVLGSDLAQQNRGDFYNAPEVGASGAALVSKDVPYRANNLLLPDLNSVSGKVQTLDIPLEIKYNVGRQFYATGGVSYAVVLSQERFNHITEYNGVPTYSSASDSDQPTNQSAASGVERTLQSSDNNVNTNGFGGFVNFSIGRKTKLTKSIKLSIEPYVKMPIGQFKRADMDYTNGGLRVITNF
ncbi:outer membrane beta-barrel protein [Sphingobacterium griseoflavum]|uniref:Outer membrane protein beta-barrel domain-containing protein n=1 Tax=Sphingobacterium griseoflavum TaxID=1474952 RepID=A0ABQ3I1Z9_9SPHI|nr:outer membrane beta-barrel protein [Sphingobacterium griseoflavum]GHE41834.1 hypothetical protein GCM10017764_26310 [Sphingobacterium griseoflavum]